MISNGYAEVIAALLLSSAVARADVAISNKPTSNMSCVSGVCTATAQKAVLNVGDLANMLAGGDVTVKTGTLAKDISLDQPLSWTSTGRLTLDAQQSVIVNKQVTVTGAGSLTVTTNDNGQPKNKSGEFIIVPERGSVQLWDSSSSLIIDGKPYALVYDIKTLAADIAANPSGFYALAKPYDASVDGTYGSSPIPTTLSGIFDGLGNAVSNLMMEFPSNGDDGLFHSIGTGGQVLHVGVLNATLAGTAFHGGYGGIGPLAGSNFGFVKEAYATGTVYVPIGTNELTGGLIGYNQGTILYSRSATNVTAAGEGIVGGIASINAGLIAESYSGGKLKTAAGNNSPGGIAGYNSGLIANTYSLAKVNQNGQCCGRGYYGGLVGENKPEGQISASYAAGKTGHTKQSGAVGGGLIGFDGADGGNASASYWNLDTGVGDSGQGAGNVKNDPGITGLTTKQLKAGLPAGFDPEVWAINPNINDGYPYLRNNRPE